MKNKLDNFLDNLLNKFEKCKKEYGHHTDFITEVIDKVDFEVINKITIQLFKKINNKWLWKNEFISYLFQDVNDFELSNINDLLKSKTIEITINTNYELSRKCIDFINRWTTYIKSINTEIWNFKTISYLTKKDNWMLYWEIIIIPKENNYYYLDEYVFWMDVNYAIENKFHLK